MQRRGVQARASTVDEQEILQVDTIREERWGVNDFGFRDYSVEVLEWLARRSLIRNTLLCVGCEIPMSFIRRARNSDGHSFKCRTCGKTMLSMKQLLLLFFFEEPFASPKAGPNHISVDKRLSSQGYYPGCTA